MHSARWVDEGEWIPTVLRELDGVAVEGRGCRCVLGEPWGGHEWYALAVSSAVGLLVLAAGLIYFRRVERTFADTI